MLMFGHMYYVLHQQVNGLRSASSEAAIRRSLTVLFVQVTLIYIYFVLISDIRTISFCFCNIFLIEMSLVMFYIISLHSIGHNVILLTITTAYGKFILNF
ncbi:hypothetical protein PENTCL1PPCAC_15611, partial [Pristionchus entomophagus]